MPVTAFYLHLDMKNLFFLVGFMLLAMSGYSQQTENKAETDKIETVFDTAPEFPGGMQSLYKFIAEKVIYPEDARLSEIQGKVMVQFVVDKEGEIKNAVIVKSVSESLDKEALRVVKSMPKWKPGILDGKPVNVYFNLPFSFKLQ